MIARAGVVLGLLLVASEAAHGKIRFAIEPGPAAVSPEERAIEPDPDGGAQHGVILIEKFESNEFDGHWTKVAFYRRAKLFSMAARDLANVEIPYNIEGGRVADWWARALLPDGTVHELPLEGLESQWVAKSHSLRVRVLRGAIPAVEPGAVIDYGYRIRVRGSATPLGYIPLQMRWPVQNLHYRFLRNPGHPTAVLIRRGAELGITTRTRGRVVDVVARDLPPLLAEPHMPPAIELGAALLFYRKPFRMSASEFWTLTAKAIAEETRLFLGDRAAIRSSIGPMRIRQDASLQGKLAAAHDWIGANIRNLSLPDAERLASEEDTESGVERAADVLEKRRGSDLELDLLFAGLARELGAEAHIVMAVDRTRHYFNPEWLALEQFDSAVVAVKAPGDERYTFVDAGSGLPYGQVPWWLSGVDGLLMRERSSDPVPIPAARAAESVSRTEARLAFVEGDRSLAAEWNREGTGQTGYDERWTLRATHPRYREELAAALCGEGPKFAVTTAVTPPPESLGGYSLTCSGVAPTNVSANGSGGFAVPFTGPWIVPVPDLAPGERRHPVVFRFPRTDVTTLRFAAPAGFAPGPAPDAVRVASPFGEYRLQIEVGDSGFEVDRSFVLRRLAVPVEQYDPLVQFLQQVRWADSTLLEFRPDPRGRVDAR